MPQATATLSRSTTAAIAGTAAAIPDILATVNAIGRIIHVRPITAIINPTTALIGPAGATIGRITGITGGRGSDLEFISASSTDALPACASATRIATRSRLAAVGHLSNTEAHGDGEERRRSRSRA